MVYLSAKDFTGQNEPRRKSNRPTIIHHTVSSWTGVLFGFFTTFLLSCNGVTAERHASVLARPWRLRHLLYYLLLAYLFVRLDTLHLGITHDHFCTQKKLVLLCNKSRFWSKNRVKWKNEINSKDLKSFNTRALAYSIVQQNVIRTNPSKWVVRKNKGSCFLATFDHWWFIGKAAGEHFIQKGVWFFAEAQRTKKNKIK